MFKKIKVPIGQQPEAFDSSLTGVDDNPSLDVSDCDSVRQHVGQVYFVLSALGVKHFWRHINRFCPTSPGNEAIQGVAFLYGGVVCTVEGLRIPGQGDTEIHPESQRPLGCQSNVKIKCVGRERGNQRDG